MSDSDKFSRSIPFGVKRGTTQDPSDRTPKRGATTGLGAEGEPVVHVPGEGTHGAGKGAGAIETPDPVIPEPRDE